MKALIDFFRSSLCLLKWRFLALFSSIFSAIYSYIPSKFAKKFAQKSPIFPNKASFERSLVLVFSLILAPLIADSAWQSKDNSNLSAALKYWPQKAHLGQPIEFTLTMHYPAGYQFDGDIFMENLLRGVNMLAARMDLTNYTLSEPAKTAQGLTQTLRFSLEPLVPGPFPLSFLHIPFKPLAGNGKILAISGEIISLEVSVPRNDTKQPVAPEIFPLTRRPQVTAAPALTAYPADEKDRNRAILDTKNLPPLWKMAGVALIMLLIWNFALVKAIFYETVYKWWKMKDPKKTALHALQKLAISNRKEAAVNWHQYYLEVSEVLKEFLEGKYHLPAKYATTQELLHAVGKHSEFSDLHKLLLEEFMRNADLVKFAKYVPSVDDCANAYTAAKQFIEAN